MSRRASNVQKWRWKCQKKSGRKAGEAGETFGSTWIQNFTQIIKPPLDPNFESPNNNYHLFVTLLCSAPQQQGWWKRQWGGQADLQAEANPQSQEGLPDYCCPLGVGSPNVGGRHGFASRICTNVLSGLEPCMTVTGGLGEGLGVFSQNFSGPIGRIGRAAKT